MKKLLSDFTCFMFFFGAQILICGGLLVAMYFVIAIIAKGA